MHQTSTSPRQTCNGSVLENSGQSFMVARSSVQHCDTAATSDVQVSDDRFFHNGEFIDFPKRDDERLSRHMTMNSKQAILALQNLRGSQDSPALDASSQETVSNGCIERCIIRQQ